MDTLTGQVSAYPESCLIRKFSNSRSMPQFLTLPPSHILPQIGSCSDQMGQVAIVSFQSSNPKVIECFNVESRILCMVYIPAEEPKPQESGEAVDPEATASRASHVPTICLGTEEGR